MMSLTAIGMPSTGESGVPARWRFVAASAAFRAPFLSSVTKAFTGDIEAEGSVEYLMMYRGDGSATFVGLERVVGRIDGKSGTFVLQRSGVFEGGLAKESYSVVPGSATGELRGLQGEGTTAVGHGMEHPFALDYEL